MMHDSFAGSQQMEVSKHQGPNTDPNSSVLIVRTPQKWTLNLTLTTITIMFGSSYYTALDKIHK